MGEKMFGGENGLPPWMIDELKKDHKDKPREEGEQPTIPLERPEEREESNPDRNDWTYDEPKEDRREGGVTVIDPEEEDINGRNTF